MNQPDKQHKDLVDLLEKMKLRIWEESLDMAQEMSVKAIYVPQVLAMAAAGIILEIHDRFDKQIAHIQAINSFGGAIQTLNLNGMKLPDYDHDTKETVNVLIAPDKRTMN